MRERLGYAPFAADPLSLLGWLDREEPDSLDRIEHVLFCKDYLKFRLTGRVCTDEMEGASSTAPATTSTTAACSRRSASTSPRHLARGRPEARRPAGT